MLDVHAQKRLKQVKVSYNNAIISEADINRQTDTHTHTHVMHTLTQSKKAHAGCVCMEMTKTGESIL